MEKKQTGSFYIYVIIGSIGILLVAFGLLEYIWVIGNTSNAGFLLTFAGFMVLVHYIYYLEKKAGIRNTVIWIKSAVLASTLLIFTYLFY